MPGARPDRPPSSDAGFFTRVYEVVSRVPRGRVVTYGQVAFLAGVPRGARAVGWALRALGRRGPRVPWHRVVGADGLLRRHAGGPADQAKRLAAEGIPVRRGRVDLEAFGLR